MKRIILIVLLAIFLLPSAVLADMGLNQIVILPEKPNSSMPVRVLGTSRDLGKKLEIVVTDADGKELRADRYEAWGYKPQAVSAYFNHLPEGDYRVNFLSDGNTSINSLFTVVEKAEKDNTSFTGAWEIRKDWSPAMEDLYSVFVAKLFYVQAGAGKKGWKPLHSATRDPYRNILYGILAYDEDNADAELSVKLEPDCADAPYMIRAYFAWKLALAYGFHWCDRGSSNKGPRNCSKRTILDFKDQHSNPVERFNRFSGEYLAWKIQSGAVRALPESNGNDVYPIDLSDIRPGDIFVDAGGHVILVSQVEAQTDRRIGVLYGVDAHPDRTVSHKLFGGGTFVFNPNVSTDGFKAFRPVLRSDSGLVFLNNETLTKNPGYRSWSDQQSEIRKKSEFYASMIKTLNPKPIDPYLMMQAKIEMFLKLMEERVDAVEIGVSYMKKRRWATIAMPNGPKIFQTTGSWEDYSTPARDLRMLIALDEVMNFPAQVFKHSKPYFIAEEKALHQIKRELIELRDRLLSEKSIFYTRSDGSRQTLTLAEIVSREKNFQMAYNPNDCIEIRWAANSGSEEMKSCSRRAPKSQTNRMFKQYRKWFEGRRRPEQR